MKLENKIKNVKNWAEDFCKDPHFYLCLTGQLTLLALPLQLVNSGF